MGDGGSRGGHPALRPCALCASPGEQGQGHWGGQDRGDLVAEAWD